MTDLDALFKTIDTLTDAELETIYHYINQRRKVITPEERIAALEQGFAMMRKGIIKAELDEIIDAMNSEYINPDDLSLFDWIDEE